MALHAAIVTDDLKLAGAIYGEILHRVDALTCQQHLDVTVYAGRDFPNKDEDFNIYEGTRVVNKMGAHFAVFPEIRVTQLSPNRLPVAKLDLPLFTEDLIEQIGQGGKADRMVREYADAIIKHAENKYGIPQQSHLPRNRSAIAELGDRVMEEAADTKRHPHGAMVFFGGQGPEAGNEALLYAMSKLPGQAVLLESQPTIANPVEYYLSQHDPARQAAANPIPALVEEAKKADALGFDSMAWFCNSINGPDIFRHVVPQHYFFGDANDPDAPPKYNTKVINIIEEAVATLPEGAKVLLLATESTIAMHSFQKAAEKLSKNTEFIVPDGEHQKLVNDAIWEHIIPGDIETGKQKLHQVIEHYEGIHGKNIMKMAGCTDLPVALEGVPGVVDTIKTAVDKMSVHSYSLAAHRRGERPESHITRIEGVTPVNDLLELPGQQLA